MVGNDILQFRYHIPGPQCKDCGVVKFTDCTIKSDIRAKIEIIYK